MIGWVCETKERKKESPIPLLMRVIHKSIFNIVEYKYYKSWDKDFKLQDLILRTRICGSGFIPQNC